MNTHLENFISRKIETHIEPSRKGTPRGNPIGIGKIKYQAALISTLTNFNLEFLSKQVKGKYGVVRKWRTQADFKACSHSISNEFKSIIDWELTDIFIHLAEDYKRGRFHDHAELFERFIDSNTYNKQIINHIVGKLNHYVYELPNGDVAFHDMVYYLAKYSGAPMLLEFYNQLQKRLKEHLLEEAIESLEQPELSDEEKGGVVFKLKRLIA